VALIGKWVAALGTYGASVLADQSASAADGTLTGGAAWEAIQTPAAVHCPSGAYCSVPDNARWQLPNNHIILATFRFRGTAVNVAGSAPAVIGQNQGAGSNPKWALYYDVATGKTSFHVNTGSSNEFLRGNVWTPALGGTVHQIGIRSHALSRTFYRGHATDGTATGTIAIPNVAAVVQLGEGGESFFASDIDLFALRIYDDDADLATDSDVYAAFDEDYPTITALASPYAYEFDSLASPGAGGVLLGVPPSSYSVLTFPSLASPAGAAMLGCNPKLESQLIVLNGDVEIPINSGRDDLVGTPLPPSQKQAAKSILKGIRWPVTAGAHSFSIDCKYTPNTTPRPRIILRANSAVGIPADIVVDAPAGTGWVTLTANITALASGVVEIWREFPQFNPLNSGDMIRPPAYANWDHIVVT
jgi:hypothetical protein